MRSFILLLYNGSNFAKLDELLNSLESNFGIIGNSFEPDHFIHVIGRNWPYYIFFFLVVPDFFILLELALVHLVEEGKWSRLVDFLPFFCLFLFWFWLLLGYLFFLFVFHVELSTFRKLIYDCILDS